ncbi:MAG: uracil-DNA glycosylase [Opitutaceae bacterium]
MPEGLDAIYDELRRLQKKGVDRVYVDDATQALLKPIPKQAEPLPAKGAPQEHANLAELVKKAPTPKTKAPTPAKKQIIEPLPEAPALSIPDGDSATQMKWLQGQIMGCSTCKERKGKDEQIVLGNGSLDADILFCGEAPGTDEAAIGKPFVGNAGQFLDKIIKAMGLSRETVYCTNLLKWRPENDKPYGNRPPEPEEMAFCLPYFEAECTIVKPKTIIALGNHAVNGLLGQDPSRKFGSVRGTWASFQDVPVMITFHPSYLLRNNTNKTKRIAWEDLLKAMEKVGLPISEKQRGFFLSK